jgi:hypothetical protein
VRREERKVVGRISRVSTQQDVDAQTGGFFLCLARYRVGISSGRQGKTGVLLKQSIQSGDEWDFGWNSSVENLPHRDGSVFHVPGEKKRWLDYDFG